MNGNSTLNCGTPLDMRKMADTPPVPHVSPTIALGILLRWRLTRFAQARSTPYLFAAYVAGGTLITGGVLSWWYEALELSTLGKVLHHTLVSYLLVAGWAVGPLMAGLRPIRDRKTRAWEALAAAPVHPRVVALSQVLGATAELWLLQSGLLPLTFIAWLLNGIDGVELSLAWLFILANAHLSAVTGSCLASCRAGPWSLTMAGMGVAAVGLLGLGLAGSLIIPAFWPALEAGWPVWFPTVWRAAAMDWAGVACSVWIPVVLTLTFVWWAIEAIAINLSHPHLKRSRGLTRWHRFTALPLWTALLAPRLLVGPSEALLAYTWSTAALLSHAWLCTYLFLGQPQACTSSGSASDGASRAAVIRCLTVCALQLLALAALAWWEQQRNAGLPFAGRLALACLSGLAFLIFTSGAVMRVRRSRRGGNVRLMFLAITFALIAMPVGQRFLLSSATSDSAPWVTAWIPVWGAVLAEPTTNGGWPGVSPAPAVVVACMSWLLVGFWLWWRSATASSSALTR